MGVCLSDCSSSNEDLLQEDVRKIKAELGAQWYHSMQAFGQKAMTLFWPEEFHMGSKMCDFELEYSNEEEILLMLSCRKFYIWSFSSENTESCRTT